MGGDEWAHKQRRLSRKKFARQQMAVALINCSYNSGMIDWHIKMLVIYLWRLALHEWNLEKTLYTVLYIIFWLKSMCSRIHAVLPVCMYIQWYSDGGRKGHGYVWYGIIYMHILCIEADSIYHTKFSVRGDGGTRLRRGKKEQNCEIKNCIV